MHAVIPVSGAALPGAQGRHCAIHMILNAGAGPGMHMGHSCGLTLNAENGDIVELIWQHSGS